MVASACCGKSTTAAQQVLLATRHGLVLPACIQVMLPDEVQREAILRVTLQRHALDNEVDEELLSMETGSAGERPLQVLLRQHLHVLRLWRFGRNLLQSDDNNGMARTAIAGISLLPRRSWHGRQETTVARICSSCAPRLQSFQCTSLSTKLGGDCLHIYYIKSTRAHAHAQKVAAAKCEQLFPVVGAVDDMMSTKVHARRGCCPADP